VSGAPCIGARAFVVAAAVLSVGLAAGYLAAGGGSYEPTAVADPCEPRAWRSPDSAEEAGQQFALSALDGAACELRVARETLAVALATPGSRATFAAEHGVDAATLERAVRAGVLRAIEDAEEAGALPPIAAGGLAALAANLPVDELVALIEDADEVLADAKAFLGGFDVGGVRDRIEELLP
jgi:hypothetical protein